MAAAAAQRQPLQPHLTDAGRQRYAAREREACGPVQFTARVQAVAKAHRHGDWRMLSGALEDVAAAAIAWAQRVREEKQRSYS